MFPLIEQIIHQLDTPPGHLVYSLVLMMTTFGALVASWYASGLHPTVEGKRMQQGLLFLFVGQVGIFIISWLVWLGVFDVNSSLPPLNSLVTLFSLILVIWLWAFPKPNSIFDKITFVLELLVIGAGVTSIVWWFNQEGSVPFNSSLPGAYAYYIGIMILIIGLILIIWQRPVAWGWGIAMLILLLGGYLVQLFFPQPPGDFAWFVLTAEMISYPMLFILPSRLTSQSVPKEVAGEQAVPIQITPRIDESFIQSVIELNRETSTQNYYKELTRLFAHLMNAEYCLLAILPMTGEQIIIPAGYNLSNEKVIDGFTADGRKMVSLLDALRNNNSLRLDGTNPTSEVTVLASELGYTQTTHLMSEVIKQKNSSATAGILLLSKASMPPWSDIDAVQLNSAIKLLAFDFNQIGEAGISTTETQAILDELQRTQAEAMRLHKEYAQLKTEFDQLSTQGPISPVEAAGAAILFEKQKQLQEAVRTLEIRNRELESLVSRGRPSIEEMEQLRQELTNALKDLARIPTTLSKSDQKMLEMQLTTMKHLDDIGQSEMVTSIVQELRQPLASIIGYTELLLGESVGLLGAMQRKFLERVKASSERMGILMDELVEVIAIDHGRLDQTTTNVDLETVIDDAVGSVINQISEKNITMRVDVPEKLPEIQANRDALLQILSNLLQNACLVTPPDGDIKLYSRVAHKDGSRLLLVSVTDQGGGITQADVPRVFSRRYKMENTRIEGIGDTGVGLSIVKSLVELLKGRVWVDTQEGTGSTFSVLLHLGEDESLLPKLDASSQEQPLV